MVIVVRIKLFCLHKHHASCIKMPAVSRYRRGRGVNRAAVDHGKALENFGSGPPINIVLRVYGLIGSAMKTTVEVPDELYRRAKAEAALRGRKFRELVEEGLRLALETPRKTRRQPSLAGLMKRARGVIDSEIPDLASNPEHLAGFGRDARHR
jgi:hypothetical protein